MINISSLLKIFFNIVIRYYGILNPIIIDLDIIFIKILIFTLLLFTYKLIAKTNIKIV